MKTIAQHTRVKEYKTVAADVNSFDTYGHACISSWSGWARWSWRSLVNKFKVKLTYKTLPSMVFQYLLTDTVNFLQDGPVRTAHLREVSVLGRVETTLHKQF